MGKTALNEGGWDETLQIDPEQIDPDPVPHSPNLRLRVSNGPNRTRRSTARRFPI